MKKILLIFMMSWSFGISAQIKHNKTPLEDISTSAYHPSIVIVKLRSDESTGFSKTGRSPSNTFSEIGNRVSVKSTSAIVKTSVSKSNGRSAGSHPLRNIYKIELNDGVTIANAIKEIEGIENIEYVEPYFSHKILAIPNDPGAAPNSGFQDYLSVIRAYDAWSIERGDTSIIIGVLDTGMQPDHPDLRDNVAYNYDDPINGIDDDNDGLIDNFIGWDIADNDNNPTADTNPHGTWMSGISSASTDNFAGMAGVGYRTRFMPIKIFKSGSDFFFGGYEAIALAADLGCKVINLSWGSPNSFSEFGQDVINYAVLERNVAIVAAAGNDRSLSDFYPASFDNVLSVAATALDDTKAFFSSFSYNVDISAPGADIYSTTNGNSYEFRSGTSQASSVTAGAMALVRARFPDLTGQQVMEKIRVNTDDIYEVGGNIDFDGRLGSGRLNILRALQNNNSPSLRIQNISYDNGSGSHAFYGDTLTIVASIKNFLSPSSNASVMMTSTSPYVEILDNYWQLGQLNTLTTTSNGDIPFKVRLLDDLPPGEGLDFRLTMEDGTYEDFQHFTITSSGETLDIDNGKVLLTVTSDGDLGYDNSRLLNGNGFNYLNQQLINNFGLILTNNSSTVYDNAATSFFLNDKNNDFRALENIKFYRNSTADIDARMIFEEMPSPSTESLRIEQSNLAWNNSSYVVVEYRVINQGNDPISDLHTSLLADWNINNKDFNVADWDNENKLGYVHSFDNDTIYAGIALITDQAPIYHAINNRNFNGNLADVPQVLTDQVKYDLSSQGTSNTQAGEQSSGNDVSHLMGGTISSLGVNEAEKVTLVIAVAPTLDSLRSLVNDARMNYEGYLASPPLLESFATCQDEATTIDPRDGDVFEFYDTPDLSNLIFTGSSITTPPVSDEITYYVVNKDNAFDSDVRRVSAKVKSLDINFDVNPGVLLLDENGNTQVDITDQSTDAIAWNWDFGNGFIGIVQNPIMNYPKVGTYNITLEATSDIGCIDQITKTLQVAYRSNLPDIQDQVICENESIILTASNATNLEVYSDSLLANQVFTGALFQTGLIDRDTAFYVISRDSTFQSNVNEVNINLSDIRANFNVELDTLDNSSATILNFQNDSENEVFYYWLINNEVSGINQDINFDYQGLSTLEAAIIAEAQDGCIDTLNAVIPIAESSLPNIESSEVCEGENSIIQATNDDVYVFYSNESKEEIIRKGTYLEIDSITNDTTLYISNISDLGESGLVPITIAVSEIQARFNLTSDVINTVNSSTIIPENSSINASTWQWLVNDEIVSNEENPVINADITGDYSLQLEVQNTLGCKDSISQNFRVVTITSLDNFNSSIEIYPNPTSQYIQINSPESVEYLMVDLNGNKVFEGLGLNTTIDISSYPNGIYLLKIQRGGEISWNKIIKQD